VRDIPSFDCGSARARNFAVVIHRKSTNSVRQYTRRLAPIPLTLGYLAKFCLFRLTRWFDFLMFRPGLRHSRILAGKIN